MHFRLLNVKKKDTPVLKVVKSLMIYFTKF